MWCRDNSLSFLPFRLCLDAWSPRSDAADNANIPLRVSCYEQRTGALEVRFNNRVELLMENPNSVFNHSLVSAMMLHWSSVCFPCDIVSSGYVRWSYQPGVWR